MLKNIDKDYHYIGSFEIEGTQYPGQIVHNIKKGIVILAIRIPTDALGKKYDEIPYINGCLDNGAFVTLVNNQCIYNHTQLFQYQTLNFKPEYIIFSNKDARDRKFNQFIFTVENALSWSGLTRIEGSLADKSVTFNYGECSQKCNWFGFDITFSSHLSNGLGQAPRPEEVSVIERLQIKIESSELLEVGAFLQARNNIIALISFAIKDNINIEKQYLVDSEDYIEVAHGIKEHIKHLIITPDGYRELIRNHFTDFNFFLKQLSSTMDEETTDKLNKLVPILNLYLSLFKYDDMPIEMIFLNIVQALETFHARFICDKKKEFEKSIYDRFEKNPKLDEIKELLWNANQADENVNYILLYSRLNDLLIGSQYGGIFNYFYGTDKEFPQKIVDTRHYYTHYGENKKDKAFNGKALLDAINILRILLEFHICKLFGIDKTEKVKSDLTQYYLKKTCSDK